jgi:hypothetical protein
MGLTPQVEAGWRIGARPFGSELQHDAQRGLLSRWLEMLSTVFDENRLAVDVFLPWKRS